MPKTTIGENIRSARNAANITQLDLAHRIGLKGENAGAYISRLEAGSQAPRIQTLEKIARTLGVEAASLLAGKKAAVR